MDEILGKNRLESFSQKAQHYLLLLHVACHGFGHRNLDQIHLLRLVKFLSVPNVSV